MPPGHFCFHPLSTTRTKLLAEAADGQALGTDIWGSKPCQGGLLRDSPARRSTWDAFAELVERNNGVYGGCWCIAYHSEYRRGVSDPRTLKEGLVRRAVRMPRWFSTRMTSRRAGASTAVRTNSGSSTTASTRRTRRLARWRISCHLRRQGPSRPRSWRRVRSPRSPMPARSRRGNLRGDRRGREAQGRFLFSATAELFEQFGFTRGRQVGKHAWIVTCEIDPS